MINFRIRRSWIAQFRSGDKNFMRIFLYLSYVHHRKAKFLRNSRYTCHYAKMLLSFMKISFKYLHMYMHMYMSMYI